MQATGAITGLTQGCTKAHIVRATLEAIAFQSYDLMQLMQQESTLNIEQLKVDGGACANNFLLQFQADLLAITIERPANIESTVLGATILAAMGQGIWNAETIPASLYGEIDSFTGNMPQAQGKTLLAGWHNAVNKCLTSALN